jgi:hypothetical protein
MKAKYLSISLILSLCISVIIITLYIIEHNMNNDLKTSPQIHLYELAGEGQNWSVENYQVLQTSKGTKRGNAKLIYHGDDGQLDQSNYLKFEVNEANEIVYVKIETSDGGPIGILNNIDNLGTIEEERTNLERDINKVKIETTKVTITWNDNNGITYKEIIELEIKQELIA